MAMRAPFLCQCGRIVKSGAVCACRQKLARERGARHDTKRPGARQRGYDAEWEREAKSYLARPGNERCACGAPATLVRHVKSIRTRPDLRMDKTNWRPGCQRCNAKDAVEERAATPARPRRT